MEFIRDLLEMKTKTDKLTLSLIIGVLLLSLGIGLIKFLPPIGSGLIILGSSILYVSIIALVFVL